jgi:hypothetical protein
LHATALLGAIDAVAASRMIGSEKDGYHAAACVANTPFLISSAARLGDGAGVPGGPPKAEPGAGSAGAVPRSGAALDLVRHDSATDQLDNQLTIGGHALECIRSLPSVAQTGRLRSGSAAIGSRE